MRSNRKRRIGLIVSLLVAAAIAAGLIGWALTRNMNYLFTPSQIAAGEANGYTTFRLGGMVKAGSIVRATDSLRIDFTVVDADHSMPVVYTGIAPDLFRDNQSVIATGHLDGDHFVATELLAKHDETYMPKELKDAMAKAHAGKEVEATSTSNGGTP
ncbi:MAG TPA: cytochrome c maturation protein CcmE [Rhodanobacteraceae bacterium]|nr:cytochrome c maturation protein CcmE [Rhodanobacteraceae bacterium]